MSIWTDPEYTKAPDSVPELSNSRYLKHKDIPTDVNMILKLTERHQKEMTPELRSKMEAAGGKVGEVYWVYYFDDLTSGIPVKKEYSAFKKMTALTIAMKGGKVKENGVEVVKPSIEIGDTFTVSRIGEGMDTRFSITKLTGDLGVNTAIAEKASPVASTDAPF